jgi:hypothetical protein
MKSTILSFALIIGGLIGAVDAVPSFSPWSAPPVLDSCPVAGEVTFNPETGKWKLHCNNVLLCVNNCTGLFFGDAEVSGYAWCVCPGIAYPVLPLPSVAPCGVGLSVNLGLVGPMCLGDWNCGEAETCDPDADGGNWPTDPPAGYVWQCACQ